MREASVEEHLRRRVAEMGGITIKMKPYIAGFPDRLVILPKGRMYVVELKRPKGGVVSVVQATIHNRLRNLGHEVPVLKSKEEINTWLTSLK